MARRAWGPLVAASVVVSLSMPVNGQTSGIREVSASERSLITLQTRLRFTTMIVLPDSEEILDIICGDRDFWVISATQNIAHVKPAKAGAATNLNLVTASGAIYSFLLNESGDPKASLDLKVYVAGDATAASTRPRYYSAAHVEAMEARLAEAQAAIRSAEQQAEETTAEYRRDYPTTLEFAYGAAKYERPFFVRAMWHDGQFTYVQSDARELPALYEMKDGKPAVVNFQVREGTFVVPKVLDRGYLALGDQRFSFSLQER
jgi:type IV secretory pathway VirB9-like protein